MARQEMTRQDKQDKARQDKTIAREDKTITRQDNYKTK